jgi:hypothetical protein
MAAPEEPFEGIALNAYLIGGGYETLYTRISEFEQATGARVNLAAALPRFELKELLQRKFDQGDDADADIDVFSAHGKLTSITTCPSVRLF